MIRVAMVEYPHVIFPTTFKRKTGKFPNKKIAIDRCIRNLMRFPFINSLDL